MDAAEPTASTDEDGGSVTDDEDKVDAVEEAAKGSVEETEELVLDVTTVGGPTAAIISTVGQRCTSTLHDDSLPRPRSICLFSFLIPFVCPCLDLRCPFPA